MCGDLLRWGEGEAVSHGLCRLCELTTMEDVGIIHWWERIELWIRRRIVTI